MAEGQGTEYSQVQIWQFQISETSEQEQQEFVNETDGEGTRSTADCAHSIGRSMDFSLNSGVPSGRCEQFARRREEGDFRFHNFRMRELQFTEVTAKARTLGYVPCRPWSPCPKSSGRNVDFSLNSGVPSECAGQSWRKAANARVVRGRLSQSPRP